MKAQKKGIALENIEKEMYDIAGVRIICQFVEDIDMVADLIRKRADMKVLDVRDYVHNIKDSGYRSYHMIISYEVEIFKRQQNYLRGDPDPHTGDEFLGNYRTFPSVQVPEKYAGPYQTEASQGSAGDCGA